MAWRIAEVVLSGEIDNRTKGRITGFLELADGSERIELNLRGNAHPDLAGCLIRFTNPRAQTEPFDEAFGRQQTGAAGDITAAERVKDLCVPLETFLKLDEKARAEAFHWATCLHLEWFSQQNGRVVVEGVAYEVTMVEGPLWSLSEEDIEAQKHSVEEAMTSFMEAVSDAWQGESRLLDAALEAENASEEVPPSEAALVDEAARLDLLNERISRRMENEDPDDWDRIYEEESSRLRRERGEPEPTPLTPKEEAERNAWIKEMNDAAEEALAELEEMGRDSPEPDREHPLVLRCREFSEFLRRDPNLPEGVSEEHPLWEIANGVSFASGKLAGALDGIVEGNEWPPNELVAPSVLLFLKKARGYLRDALRGLDSADEENLASAEWRKQTRERVNHLIAQTQKHIEEARQSLSD